MAVKKPRIRKVETVRERTVKASAKAQAKAQRQPRRPIRRTLQLVSLLLKRPVRLLTTPFRLRPVRFIGRIIGRVLWPRYFRNAYQELRQVSWPSRRETWKLTLAVLIFAVAFGTLAAGTDFLLDKVIRRIVFRS